MNILGINIEGLTNEKVAELADKFYDENATAENVQWRKENNLSYKGGAMENIIYNIFDMCNNFQTDVEWNGTEQQKKFKFERFQAMFS